MIVGANLTKCFFICVPVPSFFKRAKRKIAPASPLPAPLVFNTCTEQKHCQFGFFATYVKGQFLDRKADLGLGLALKF